MFNYLFKNFDDFFTFDSTVKATKKDNEYVIELEVPGFNKDNLNVEFAEGYLDIKGETDTRKYERKIYIGDANDNVNASVKDGILTITLKYEAPERKLITLS